MPSSRIRGRILLALAAVFSFASINLANVVSGTRVIAIGDPFPGRPGSVVIDEGDLSLAPTPPDASGIISIGASPSTLIADLLGYNLNTHELFPIAQSGAATLDGFTLDRFFNGPIVRNRAGQTIESGVVSLQGNSSIALLSVTPAGAVRTVIAVNAPVPQHPDGTFVETRMFAGPLGGDSYNLNDNGIVAFESQFKIGQKTHLGVYNWTAAGGLTRVIDDTQPVPGHPSGQWVDFVPGVLDNTPFDEDMIQLTDTGETIFRARVTVNGTLYRGELFRGSPGGGLTAIVDAARGDQVPGRPAGTTFFSLPNNVLANRNGDVAFAAISSGSFDRGVYLQRTGQPVIKVHDSNDPIPTVPLGTRQTIIEARAMNDDADVVVDSLFGAGSDALESLLLCTADGQTKLIARADQIARPGGTISVNFTRTCAINQNDDVLELVSFNDSSGVSTFAAYAYLADVDQFVPVLAPGDVLDGMRVKSFQLALPASGGGFGNTFGNDRTFVASVDLTPLDGRGASDLWAVYTFHVDVPEPGTALLIFLAAAMTGRPARRRI